MMAEGVRFGLWVRMWLLGKMKDMLRDTNAGFPTEKKEKKERKEGPTCSYLINVLHLQRCW